ncbi:hypothetical protein HDU86_001872 [Geranomyces michiganensis]|nr:hypothetical protein HDU86_001872 [Geranomyces michiganensis]
MSVGLAASAAVTPLLDSITLLDSLYATAFVGTPEFERFLEGFSHILQSHISCCHNSPENWPRFSTVDAHAWLSDATRTAVEAANSINATAAATSGDEIQRQVDHVSASIFDDNPRITAGVARLVESYWTQARIRTMLRDRGYGDDVFGEYLQCLQLYSDVAEHDTIMSHVWTFFTGRVDAQTLTQLRIAFLEEHVAQSLGIDFQTMTRMEGAIADQALYLDVLTYLDHSQKNNIAWYMIVDMIRSVVLRCRPEVWNELDSVLSQWRASYVEPFLAKARDMITNDEEFAQFCTSYSADPANALHAIEETHNYYDADNSDDDDDAAAAALVESLKRLQISAVPARPQGPRRMINR